MIAFWTDTTLHTLDLVIEPQLGLMKHFYDVWATSVDFSSAASGAKGAQLQIKMFLWNMDSCMVWFSGPHRGSLDAEDYESIIMIITDNGIAAQLSLLKVLIHDYQWSKIQTQCIQLIWKIGQWSKSSEANFENIAESCIDNHDVGLQLLNDMLVSNSELKSYVNFKALMLFCCDKFSWFIDTLHLDLLLSQSWTIKERSLQGRLWSQ